MLINFIQKNFFIKYGLLPLLEVYSIIIDTEKGETMLTLYHYPNCSTCKKAIKFLNEREVEYKLVNLVEKAPSKTALMKLYKTGKYPLKKFFNTCGTVYKELNLKDELVNYSDKDAIELLAKNPMLFKRPLLIKDTDFLIGFKVEELENFL